MHTLGLDDCIERLECFCGKERSRSEFANVGHKMKENVILGLVEPADIPSCGT